nr:F-box protein At4g00755-like [Ipomoea trifida]
MCCLSAAMEPRIDFLQLVERDVTVEIMLCLCDPADVVHAGAVSRIWRQCLIENGISKQLCLRKFPQLSSVARIVEQGCKTNESSVDGSSNSDFETLRRDHRVYASLLQALETLALSPSDCIDYAIGASSTDNYPLESIANTLYPRERYLNRASYWSSKGQRKPDVPETLIYRLKADFAVVTEIKIQPFEAYFQPGKPIYSAKSVRFRMGHPKSSKEIDCLDVPTDQPADEKFVWTYTSEEFPMSQENRMQTFKLPEPVLCIGGYLQIELLGRVQRQEMDDLFYICVCHVKVLGRPLSPAFEIEMLEQSGKFSMVYSPETLKPMLQSLGEGEDHEASSRLSEQEVRHIGFLGYLLGGYQPDGELLEWDDNEEIDAALAL